MYKLGFIDEDFGEVSRIEDELENDFNFISYDLSEGLELDDLLIMIHKSDIDILLIDFLMSDKGYFDFDGDKFVREFEKIKPNFPMIIFTNNEPNAFPKVDNPTIIYDKEVLNNEATKAKFIQTLNKIADNYHKKNEEKRTRINQLIEKRENEGLNAKEKNDLFNLQLDLNNLDKWNKETPEYLLNDQYLDLLSNSTNDAEETLKRLMDKYKK